MLGLRGNYCWELSHKKYIECIVNLNENVYAVLKKMVKLIKHLSQFFWFIVMVFGADME